MKEHPQRLVFLDETGVTTNMTRQYGRNLRGRRVAGTAPFSKGHKQTMIAGLSCDGLRAPWVIPGAMDREAFDTYVEKVLLPELEPGTAVICDNLSVHKSERAAELLKTKGCWFLFLPAYSPDLNPIELAFSKLKAHLRAIGARTFDQLIEAIGEICDFFSPRECWNFFKAAGYVS